MSRIPFIVLAAAIVSGIASAQYWEFEQIDTSGNWNSLQLKSGPDGTLYCCYRAADSGRVILATRDTIWHREAVSYTDRFSFDVGPHGELGLMLESTFVLKTDTGWAETPVPFPYGLISFDTAGVPKVACRVGIGDYQGLVFYEPTESTWAADTFIRTSIPVPFARVGLHGLVHDADNVPTVLRSSQAAYLDSGSCPPPGGSVGLSYRVNGVWSGRTLAIKNLYPDPIPAAMALARQGQAGVAACWWMWAAQCDSVFFDSINFQHVVVAGRVVCDSAGVPHILYARDSSGPRYATSLGGTFRRETVPRAKFQRILDADIAIHEGLPMVAVIAEDNAIWLGRRIPTGVCENNPSREVRRPAATLSRGVLSTSSSGAGRDTPGGLLDITGRRVMDLKPGPNDVSRLAPGVYFIVQQGSSGRGFKGSSQKVVVAR